MSFLFTPRGDRSRSVIHNNNNDPNAPVPSTPRSSGKEVFNIDEYEFDFNNCIKVPETRELFSKFLDSEFNKEPLLFLESVREYQKRISALHDEVLSQQKNENLERKKTATMKEMDTKRKSLKPNNSSMMDLRKAASAQELKENSVISFKNYCEIHAKFKEMAQLIIGDYLTADAEHELNVSSDSKKQVKEYFQSIDLAFEKALEDSRNSAIQSEFNQFNLKQDHFHLFSVIEHQLRTELMMDVFPRFIRNDIFKKYIAKKDPSFIKQIANPRDVHRIKRHLYTYEDWINPIVNDHDFELMRQLIADSPEWNHIYTHNKDKPVLEQSNLYFMDNAFIVGDNLPAILRNRTLAKIDLYLPFYYKDVMETVNSKEFALQIDEFLFETEHLAFTYPDLKAGRKYATSAAVYRMKFANFGLSKRELCFVASCLLDPKDPNQFLHIVRDTEPPYEKPKGYERGSSFICYMFRRINDHLTRYTSVYSVNMGGKLKKLGGMANKMVMKQRTKKFRQDILDGMKKRQQQGWQPITESNGFLETLEENTKTFSSVYREYFKDQKGRHPFTFDEEATSEKPTEESSQQEQSPATETQEQLIPQNFKINLDLKKVAVNKDKEEEVEDDDEESESDDEEEKEDAVTPYSGTITQEHAVQENLDTSNVVEE